MSTEIKVPVLPESVSDATIATWHKKVGDAVKRDENLVDLETDKVVLEVPSPVDGVLKEIKFAEGTTVNSQQIIGIVEAGAAAAAPAPTETKAAQPAAGAEEVQPKAAAAQAKAAAPATTTPAPVGGDLPPGARFTAERITGAELKVLPDGGHLMVGRGEEVQQAVASFLSRHLPLRHAA